MRPESAPNPALDRRPRGVSLIETLVTIGVIAVLLALSLPMLGRSRRSAHEVASLSLQRSLLAALAMYGGDHDQALPYLGVPGDTLRSFIHRGWTDRFGMAYFSQNKAYWLTLVVDTYVEPFPGARYDRAEAMPFFVAVSDRAVRPNPMVRSAISLTHASAAAAPFWRDDGPPPNLKHLHGTRLVHVTHPSRKGLLLDLSAGVFAPESSPSDRRVASVGFAEGSASWKPWPRDGEGFDNERVANRAMLGAIPWSVMSTRGGLSGIDY
jgi:prepilin-type N-terminal cleavage/methylation domain-containing protein